jgi:hypothetical protein
VLIAGEGECLRDGLEAGRVFELQGEVLEQLELHEEEHAAPEFILELCYFQFEIGHKK